MSGVHENPQGCGWATDPGYGIKLRAMMGECFGL